MLPDRAVEFRHDGRFEPRHVAIGHLQTVGLEVGLVAESNKVRDEPEAGVGPLELAQHEVVRLEPCGDGLEVANVARLAKHRGVADHADAGFVKRRQVRHDQVRQSGNEPVVLRVSGFVVEDRDGDQDTGGFWLRSRDGPKNHAKAEKDGGSQPGGKYSSGGHLLSGGNFWSGILCHRGNEAIAALRQGLHKAWILAAVTECGADLRDAVGEATIEVDVGLTPPHAGFQFLAADHLTGVSEQQRQRARRLRLEADHTAVLAQHAGRGVELKSAEPVNHLRIRLPFPMTQTRRLSALTIGLLAFSAVTAAAQTAPIDYETARRDRKLPATRAAGPIVLDGKLDEASWAGAPVAKGFIQNDPREGRPATYDTEVRLLYDNEALYFGVYAIDPEPGQIIVNELRKDYNTGNADGFSVIIDSFHDERNGYQFSINPSGAKWDAQVSNEGRDNNANWDGIWDVATRIGDTGWYAEIKIPFKTLKFTAEDLQTWGINFQRRLRRQNENSYWSPIRRIDQITRVSMAGSVEGLQGLKPGANLRFKPYALGNFSTVAGATTGKDYNAGFDAKYGVTNGLTWDFTVNTDFSQVEADEQQVNLTRFSLFFPEKRDFFLENSGVFQFGLPGQGGGGAGGGAQGRQNVSQDMVFFFSRQIGLSPTGDSIPIVAGTRLTGRAGEYSIGALNIQQQEQGTSPATNFTALRLRRNVLANSDVGVMFLNKESAGPDFNRGIGADANFRFFKDLTFNLAVAKTDSPESKVPGTGDDYYSKTAFGWRTRVWETRGAYQTIGTRLNDEMGFVPRTGVDNSEFYLGRHIRPKKFEKWLRETMPHFQLENFNGRHGGGLQSRYMDWHWPLTFQNSTNMELGINPNVEVLDSTFTINSRRHVTVAPGRYEFKEYFVFVNSNAAARFSTNLRYGTGDFYDGTKNAYQVGGTFRMNEHLNVSLSDSINDIALPTGAFVTNLVTGRVNYYFNTKVFVNALLQYNTDTNQWSSNVRLDIIHHPLSDIYIVYNERHDSVTGNMLSRALIAKMTYLMAF